ncbi:MFS transporter [Capnocytophaga catalasegens]|uniref:MFS transporter n=1 Tax=Capnocytophaga catalasegens TaxID=1004260 RepID=A0AAV5ASG5_9FLAO|nr:MFS transporter [Capnocytophaga catalasegens]GIZ15624.1 MFS transporter [Capnocytophaga catalasegens]GJM49519.1 MFS transporter [Capnocytophaga catalasegens]GJM51772.1 MFS transporter [Capnocytophaga catalasegens]
MTQKNNLMTLLPVMLAFFCMGFVDLVGAATNYVKADFQLSETIANILPSIVFFWFLLFSVPTGVLMGKIGRRKTVILSLIVTAISLIIPFINYSYISMLISFSLLGIGNTLMQVSLNPLLSSIVKGDKLASSLTFGQFVKAIASFIATILMIRFALMFENWKLLFPLFAIVSVIAILWLGFTSIDEEKTDSKNASFAECFALLGDKFILLCFIGIMCHVGIDVGVNVTAPKLLQERLNIPLDDSMYATSVYFLFRTIGCFSGAFILSVFSPKKFFGLSVACMIIAMAGFFIFDSKTALYVAVALVGFGNSNIFPIIFSQALLHKPDKKNEVSGLMIMGLFGGTVFPFFMGIASDMTASQMGALAVLSIGVAYLILMTLNLREKVNQ